MGRARISKDLLEKFIRFQFLTGVKSSAVAPYKISTGLDVSIDMNSQNIYFEDLIYHPILSRYQIP